MGGSDMSGWCEQREGPSQPYLDLYNIQYIFKPGAALSPCRRRRQRGLGKCLH